MSPHVDEPRARLDRAEEILLRASTLSDEERAAEVARLCCAEPDLAAEVSSLLDHADRMGDFLEEPALGLNFVLLPALADVPAGADGECDNMVGRSIGRYRIEKRIASGGMGTVYLAERADEQFTQRVALKLVKRGMDTDDILQRFRRERQTLAALEHPNIARLIDGGATQEGQPYLVMEFVEGEPIDGYCDLRRVDIDARLELFLIVCDTVRYAHQKLVVHRDLKPGNILVTRDGTPKLLDFGIATVIDSARRRQVTGARERRLTPEYASPEQIAGAAVATTSDVYSLGVVLYELLTGSRPYDLTARTPEEIQRVVVDTQPPVPSEAVRLAQAPADRRAAASLRRCTSEQLARRLRGDLDTIVLAALRKEPERRYPSVEALAADIRRHLDHLPVSARRDTVAYRTSKFVRRHALATTLAVVSLLLLFVGSVAFAWQANVARRERDEARVARAQSEATTAFLQDMLASVDPSRSGLGVTVQEVLNEAARNLDSELDGQPLVQASLHTTIGATYLALGLYDDAETHMRKAHQQRLALLDPRHYHVAQSMGNLGALLYAKGAFDEAGILLEGTLTILRDTSGPPIEVTRTVSALGAVRRAQGRLEEAEELQREALELRRAAGKDSLDEAESLNNLATVLVAQKRYDEARPLADDALRIRRERLGEEHRLVAQSMDNLGVLLCRTGDLDAAEPLYVNALELEIRLLGPSHPDVAVTHRNLASLLTARGRHAEAEEHLRQCLAIRETLFEASDPRCVITQLDLAECFVSSGQRDAALPLVEAVLDATQELSPDTQARKTALSRGAELFERCGQLECAADLRAQQSLQ